MIQYSPTVNQIEVTYDLLIDRNETLNKLYFLQDTSIFPRLNHWLFFFNENQNQSILLYTSTITAVADVAKNSPLFEKQTQHEFDISTKFYETIFELLPFIEINNSDDAKLLLNISLIYGLYPGMVIRSLRKGVLLLKNGVNNHSLNKLFKFLFVKYENPHFLSHNLNNLNTKELEVLMHLLQGNNIRTFKGLPFPISKKESYYFSTNFQGNIQFKEDILEKSIVPCKLLSAHPNAELLESFLHSNRNFKHNIHDFYLEIDFWKSVFKFLGRFEWEEIAYQMGSYVDYIIYKRFMDDSNYTLKSRTPNSLTRAMHQWHEMGAFTNQKELTKKVWGKSKPMKFELNNEKYLFEEITFGKDLLLESKEMKNCVFSYIQSCIRGHIRIWSAKKEVNSKYVHYLTIEVESDKVVQIARIRNGMPTKKDLDSVKVWGKKMEFTMEGW